MSRLHKRILKKKRKCAKATNMAKRHHRTIVFNVLVLQIQTHKYNKLCNEQLFSGNILQGRNSTRDDSYVSLWLIKITVSSTLSYFIGTLKQV